MTDVERTGEGGDEQVTARDGAELVTSSTDGVWAFRFVLGNGRVVASGDDYQTEGAMRRGIDEAEAVLAASRTRS